MNQKTDQFSAIRPVSRRTATIANLIHQYVAVGLSIINGIILVPLYLKYIDLNLYGAWLATGSIIAWLGMVDAGFFEIIRQQTAKAFGSRDMTELGCVMSTGMFCNAAIGILPALVGIAIAPSLGLIFHLEPVLAKELFLSFILAGLSCSFVLISGAASAGLQGLQRNVSVCVVFVTGSLVGIAVTIWMILKGYGVMSIPMGLLVRGIIWTIFYWVYCYYLSYYCLGIHWCFSRKHLGQIANLTSWTFFSNISYAVISQSDALVVGLMLGVEATPLYVLSRRSWDMLQTFLTRIGVAFMPALAHLHGEVDHEKFSLISRRLLRVCIYAAILGASTCLAMNNTFIKIWVGPKLYAGHLFDEIMAVAMILMIYNWTINSVLYARGIIKQPAIVGVGQNFFRAIMLILLVWQWKINGTTASMLFGAIATVPYFAFQWHKIGQVNRVVMRSEYIHYIISAVILLLFGMTVSRTLSLQTWTGFVITTPVYILIVLVILVIIDKNFRMEAQPVFRKIFGSKRIPSRKI